MTSTTSRLVVCFQNVFPNLGETEVRGASTETVGAWDSVAHITLLSAVAEEFNVEFEPEEYIDLTSFEDILQSVEAKVAE